MNTYSRENKDNRSVVTRARRLFRFELSILYLGLAAKFHSLNEAKRFLFLRKKRRRKPLWKRLRTSSKLSLSLSSDKSTIVALSRLIFREIARVSSTFEHNNRIAALKVSVADGIDDSREETTVSKVLPDSSWLSTRRIERRMRTSDTPCIWKVVGKYLRGMSGSCTGHTSTSITLPPCRWL